MQSWFRKLRGAVGNALVWAGAWAIGGFGVATFVHVLGPGLGGAPFWEVASLLALRSGMWGFIAGGTFSTVLGMVYGRRTLGELDSPRMGLWGAFAGLLFPLSTLAVAYAMAGIPLRGDVIGSAVFILGGLGVATAVGTLKLAQMSTVELASGGVEHLLVAAELAEE